MKIIDGECKECPECGGHSKILRTSEHVLSNSNRTLVLTTINIRGCVDHWHDEWKEIIVHYSNIPAERPLSPPSRFDT